LTNWYTANGVKNLGGHECFLLGRIFHPGLCHPAFFRAKMYIMKGLTGLTETARLLRVKNQKERIRKIGQSKSIDRTELMFAPTEQSLPAVLI
jgi:hypothetical protein